MKKSIATVVLAAAMLLPSAAFADQPSAAVNKEVKEAQKAASQAQKRVKQINDANAKRLKQYDKDIKKLNADNQKRLKDCDKTIKEQNAAVEKQKAAIDKQKAALDKQKKALAKKAISTDSTCRKVCGKKACDGTGGYKVRGRAGAASSKARTGRGDASFSRRNDQQRRDITPTRSK